MSQSAEDIQLQISISTEIVTRILASDRTVSEILTFQTFTLKTGQGHEVQFFTSVVLRLQISKSAKVVPSILR